MLKQYFYDGLVQIAIVLSLLRTDLPNYISSDFVNYPEVQEIIQGQTVVYSQTDLHNNFRNSIYGHIDRKSLDPDITPLLQDLRSLRRIGRWYGASRPISTFLVNVPPNEPQNEPQAASSSPDLNDNGQTSTADPNQDEDNTVFNNDLNGNVNPDEIYTPNSFSYTDGELTHEDLDLIDVLWRQDIDLGVGKEVFDLNLRRELEREREIELQKERQKQKEREILQRKLEEQRRQQEQQWLTENFMRDGETGEWIPLHRNNPGSTMPPQIPQQQLPQAQQTQTMLPNDQYQNYMQYGEGMNMVNSPQPMSHEEDYSISSPMEQYHSPPPQHMQHQQQHSQVQQHMQNYMQNNYNQTVPQNSEPYQRQDSLEQTWQDLVNLLQLPGNESHTALMNTSLNSSDALMAANMLAMSQSLPSPTRNHSSVLIQNATLPTPPPINNTNVVPNFDNTGLGQTTTNFTSNTSPMDNGSNPQNWDTPNILFPNGTCVNQTETVDEFLPGIIGEEELEDLNITDLALNEGFQSLQMLDDASSESGVSMGSSASPIQDSFSDAAMSPYDSVEGAMGGKDYDSAEPSYNKASKFEPEDYSYSNGGYGYSNGESSQSNYSSSSNDSEFNHNHHHHHPSKDQIRHNHTYPLMPGQEPKEYKKYTQTDKPKHKGPQCRDSKRIQELNIPLTLDQIVESPVEEFNEILTRHKFSEVQLQLIRDIRRRGKNKVAAQNCRKRKMDVIVDLSDDLDCLKSTRDRLIQERHLIDKETREMKDKFSSLYREIFQSLRDENGRPYDPQLFSLQQSSDGNVFLVPRNLTSEEHSPHGKCDKKRKNDRK